MDGTTLSSKLKLRKAFIYLRIRAMTFLPQKQRVYLTCVTYVVD